MVPRVQVRCSGLGTFGPTLISVHHGARDLLRSHSDAIGLAVLRIARMKGGLYQCDTQLFGRGLEHVSGYAEYPDAVQAAMLSLARALRVRDACARFNPWTSSHPSCQRGAMFV